MTQWKKARSSSPLSLQRQLEISLTAQLATWQQNNLSKSDMAQKLNISVSELNQILFGSYIPNLEELLTYFDLLNLTIKLEFE
ncbi:helix-turn-helix domain-containing protein [Enterococcus sp. CSURQ0835]|uniref:helix-turn-helix domain-containing protein n=1 Tax=Enterococcus sp. CSURQ0835 TaxID=2681394 RepID=UPI00135865DB|nr:helix-turn-helix transcriptional regulator [Enterococcus sp. CSURQ0835]